VGEAIATGEGFQLEVGVSPSRGAVSGADMTGIVDDRGFVIELPNKSRHLLLEPVNGLERKPRRVA